MPCGEENGSTDYGWDTVKGVYWCLESELYE